MRSEAGSARQVRLVLGAAVAAVGALALGIMVGGHLLSLPEVGAALGHRGTVRSEVIVWDTRIPRTTAAGIAGLGLGLAASLLQVLTRNPVADAGLLGANAGATVMVAFGMTLGAAGSFWARSGLALVGALAATGFVCAVALGRSRFSVARLVLLGVALGAVLMGITQGLMLADPRAFDGMRHWLAGSTVGVPAGWTVLAAVLVGTALVAAVLVARPLELTVMGDDMARALGARLLLIRSVAAGAVALASAAATALIGPVSFVGLIAAHLALKVAHPSQVPAGVRHVVAALSAAVLLIVADVAGRVVLWPGEMPAGIVISVVGAPILLWIVRRTRVVG